MDSHKLPSKQPRSKWQVSLVDMILIGFVSAVVWFVQCNSLGLEVGLSGVMWLVPVLWLHHDCLVCIRSNLVFILVIWLVPAFFSFSSGFSLKCLVCTCGWRFGCFVPVVVKFLSVVETLVVHLLVAWFACVVVWSTSASAGLASHHFRFLHVLLVFVLILFVGEHNGVEALGIGLGFLQLFLLMLLHVTVWRQKLWHTHEKGRLSVKEQMVSGREGQSVERAVKRGDWVLKSKWCQDGKDRVWRGL